MVGSGPLTSMAEQIAAAKKLSSRIPDSMHPVISLIVIVIIAAILIIAFPPRGALRTGNDTQDPGVTRRLPPATMLAPTAKIEATSTPASIVVPLVVDTPEPVLIPTEVPPVPPVPTDPPASAPVEAEEAPQPYVDQPVTEDAFYNEPPRIEPAFQQSLIGDDPNALACGGSVFCGGLTNAQAQAELDRQKAEREKAGK